MANIEAQLDIVERFLDTVTAEAQIGALVRLGYSVADATLTVMAAIDLVPTGIDLATWLPSPEALDAPVRDLDALRARLDWYATAPTTFKRLLDAGLRQAQPAGANG